MPLNFIEAKAPPNSERSPKVFNENLLINLIKSASIKTNTGKYKASSQIRLPNFINFMFKIIDKNNKIEKNLFLVRL